MSPCSRIGKDLRLSASSCTPEENSSVIASEALNSCGSLIFWLPHVIAELVVALQVQLVIDCFLLLHVAQLAQVGFVELQD